jgi:hypothetical protein
MTDPGTTTAHAGSQWYKKYDHFYFRRNLANGRPLFNLDVTGAFYLFMFIFILFEKWRNFGTKIKRRRR